MKKIIRTFLLLLTTVVLFASCEQTGGDVTNEVVTTAGVVEDTLPATSADETTAEATPETTVEVTEDVTEAVTTSATEPITEPMTEPITEPVTEPVTEPITTPTTEPVTEPAHEHLWSAWSVISDPTCTKNGKEQRTCACGEKEIKSIVVVGHTEITVFGKAPTCTADGLTEGKQCSVCGLVTVKQNVSAALGHTETTRYAKSPTCTESGLTEGKYCTVCGVVTLKQTEIKALGHKEVIDVGRAPTCVDSGLTEGRHCSVCGVVTVKQTLIPELGHNELVIPAQAATCTKEGATEGRQCAECGVVTIISMPIPATGHAEVIDRAETATCLTNGLTEGRHCEKCGEIILAQDVIPTLEHKYVTISWLAPTCTKDGHTNGSSCSVCNTVFAESKVIKATGHKEETVYGYAPTCTSEGLSDGKHCLNCGEMTQSQTVIEVSEHKIANGECSFCGFTLSIPDEYVNSTNGYITSATTTIQTKHLIFEIDPNVYVMDNFVEIVDIVTETMQEVSGMKFEGISPYCTDTGTATHAKVTVVKPEGSECGPAVAYFQGGSVISACDIVDLFALIHENAHVLNYRQSAWAYSTTIMESISTYTTYKTACEILKNHPELTILVGTPNHSISNYQIENYSALYEHPIEYWMTNTFEYSGNKNYSIGFRLAWFLDEVYGDYTKWIFAYEEYRPFDPWVSNTLSVEEQVRAFKLAYGENVFEEFYAWLKENEYKFDPQEYRTDIRMAEEINFYPTFMAEENYYLSGSVQYSDLCFDLSGGMYYLNVYQSKNISSLVAQLSVEGSATVYLYGADGKYLRSESIVNYGEIDISGAYYIIFPGEGTIYRFNIKGFN